ncbi:hypothetical protein S40285_06985 [Stachybotrys chlorohalonatus IBT 40285]|uniref:Major facilitator superfamily transporter n=1 Tax=Stachybotrys chlorohalonatus (strain IBT 40285) TaxID=1283841 RepID=A0A084QFD3_STAC4|nr:hypothetical protein S40285_06985 [Stachybotrys chlorohalonata IBT 40285]
MGLLSNPLRAREPRLPVYERVRSPTKERYSDDEYYPSDDDSDAYSADRSRSSSRNTSGSFASGSGSASTRPMIPKRKPAASKLPRSAYPYRLPVRVVRFASFVLIGSLVLMILSLIRASQVENWKVANGKVHERPKAPPLWEKFPFLERYYGGIRTMVPFQDLVPQYPPTQEGETPISSPGQSTQNTEEGETHQRDVPNSLPWDSYPTRNVEKGIKECFLDTQGTVRVPSLQYYNGRPQGFPLHVVGSYELLNLPEDVCFERYGRYGPYGFGYSIRTGGLGTGEHGENNGSALVWDNTPRVDFRAVNWADVQRRCLQTNAVRYKEAPALTPNPHGFYNAGPEPAGLNKRDSVAPQAAPAAPAAPSPSTDAGPAAAEAATEAPKVVKSGKAEDTTESAVGKVSRTAVVVRCWDEYLFREDDIANVRSMITELAMASGGRYDIHLLVQVKNDAAHAIWADHEIYEQRIKDVIPEEFRGLVTLWTETQMLALYQGMYDLYSRGPELPVHGVYRGLSMAMQYFAYQHPEYDYFWQWEMDVRYTGHYYDLFTKIEDWAKAQPRKGLWERNARFFLPSVHGTWEDFSHMARVQSEMGNAGADKLLKGLPGSKGKAPEDVVKKGDRAIWGPQRPGDVDDWFEQLHDPSPPTSYERDHYEWGVGEEADYISLSPMFDPEGTTWLLKDDITGFNRSAPLPRRANIITTSRMSRRLLMTMHRMTAFKKQFAFPEMWPATVALQHGYKAVAVPHPVFVDRKWPVEYMAQTFNGGQDGSSGGSRTSIFGEREHNMHGLSWFYNSGFAPNVYRRWLGLKVNNDGGEEFETTVDLSKQGEGVGNMPGGEGRMCLPPMLLHPIKDVELPVEVPPEEELEVATTVSDPAS